MVRLHVVDGKMQGETFDLKRPEATIGRSSDNDIVIPDERISRHHCALKRATSAVEIEDLGSANGTFVNGRSVTQARLVDGDQVRLGRHVLSLSLSGAGPGEGLVVVPEEGQLKRTSIEIVIPEFTADFVEDYIGRQQSPERLLRDLGVVYQVGNLINGVRDRDGLVRTVLDMAFEAVDAAHGFVVLADEAGKLAVKARRFTTGHYDHGLSVSSAICDTVMKRGEGMLINDALHDERFSASDSIIAHHLRSVLCAPLKSRDRILGFIYLDNPVITNAFTPDDLRLVSAIGIQAGVAIENSNLFGALEDLMFGAIGALVATVEAKDIYIKGHSERVALIGRAVGEQMNLPKEIVKNVHLSALLHDIGKIGISEAILHKEGPLSDQEREAVRGHAERGAHILANIRDMAEVARAVRHHHEFFDGGGYPDGVCGGDVPLASRILAVADSYDAMTSDRPYRGRLTQDVSLAEIIHCSGTQFDPEAVEALLKCARKHDLRAYPESHVAPTGTGPVIA